MNVIINGQVYELAQGATVAQAVKALTAETHGVAAALNGEVVSRARWETTPVAAGDRVEVLTAVQGG